MSFFPKSKSCKGGYAPTCTRCYNEKHQTDRSKLYNTVEYRRTNSLKFRENNFELNMLLATKSSAKKRGLEFNLTIDDLVIPKYCPYLNIELTRNVGKGKSVSNPSIDRIDNSKGYVKGNIQIISDLANSMKRECSINQLIVFAENIIKKHSK